MSNHTNREEWLEAALATFIRKHFAQRGYTIPPVRLSCGWPSTRGLSEKKRCIGEAWSGEAASDGVVQIFISPWLIDPNEVLATMVHELCHAAVGIAEKHNKVFGKCARAVGLEGKLTATHAGESLLAEQKVWAEALGEYPHAKLDLTKSPKKKQTTRMIKMECGECGYVARTTKKWLEDIGVLHCPKHGQMTVDNPEDLDEDGENEE